jgi:polyphosphate kinase 2 (PPK2 family)
MNALLYSAPLYIVRAGDKRRGRLNDISHALSSIPYNRVKTEKGEVAGPIQEKQV